TAELQQEKADLQRAQFLKRTTLYPPAPYLSLRWYQWDNLTHFLSEQRFILLPRPLCRGSTEFPQQHGSSLIQKQSLNTHMRLILSQKVPFITLSLIIIITIQP
ncbi:hypothetical protein ILYODFUR_028847, partial [Ilyodon furcidens]